MKRKISLILLIIVTSSILFQCQEESIDIEEQLPPVQKDGMSIVDVSDIKHDYALMNKLSSIESRTENNYLAKSDKQDLYDFKINKRFIKKIIRQGKESYTFNIKRKNKKKKKKKRNIENLVIYKYKDQYLGVIIKYDFNKKEYESLSLKQLESRSIEYYPIDVNRINDQLVNKPSCNEYWESVEVDPGDEGWNVGAGNEEPPTYENQLVSTNCYESPYEDQVEPDANNGGDSGGDSGGDNGSNANEESEHNGGGGSSSSVTTSPNAPDGLINDLDNYCAYSIFYELENGIYTEHPLKPEVFIPETDIVELNFSETIMKLFNDAKYVNYLIKNGPLPGKNATTDPGSTIVTTLSDSYLANATQLSIARTMIHEMVHAYLAAKYSNPVSFNSIDFKNRMLQYAEENGLSIEGDLNAFHHEFMGQYVEAMAYSLYEWDKVYGTGGNLGWDYYMAMGYGGLFQADQYGNIVQSTDSFNELVPNAMDRKKIADILINEQEGNNEAEGTTCN